MLLAAIYIHAGSDVGFIHKGFADAENVTSRIRKMKLENVRLGEVQSTAWSKGTCFGAVRRNHRHISDLFEDFRLMPLNTSLLALNAANQHNMPTQR
jgi:hypothetical protein